MRMRRSQAPRLSEKLLLLAVALTLFYAGVAPARALASSVQDLSAVSLSSPAAGADGVSWSFTLKTSGSGAIASGGSVTVTASAGKLPECASLSDTTSDTTISACSAANPGASETYPLPSGAQIGAGDDVTVKLPGTTNPVMGSGYFLTVSTSSDTAGATTPSFAISAAQRLGDLSAVSMSSSAAGANAVSYSISFRTSSTGALVPGSTLDSGSVTVRAPAGTTLPEDCADIDDSTSGRTFEMCTVLGSSGATATYAMPAGSQISAGDSVTLTLVGTGNPGAGSANVLTVSTSSDTIGVATPSYAITPAQSVGGLSTVTMSTSAANATGVDYSLSFTASSTGTVLQGSLSDAGSVNVEAPAGTTLPLCGMLADSTSGKSFAVCGDNPAASQMYGWDSANQINAGDHVTLTLDGVTNPGVGNAYRLQVSTSSDTVAASTPGFDIGSGTQVTGLTAVTLSTTAAGASGLAYSFGFTTSKIGALVAGGSVSVQAPSGTTLPSCATVADSTSDQTFNACAADIPAANETYVLAGSAAIAAGDHVTVTLDGVTNPAVGSAYRLSVSTSSDTVAASTPSFALSAAQAVSDVSALSLSSLAGDATGVSYGLRFTASSTGALLAGSGTITIVAPAGTILPACAGLQDETTGQAVDGCGTTAGGGATATYTVRGAGVGAGDVVSVTLDGVENPPIGTGYTLGLSTSSDSVSARTPNYAVIQPGPPTITRISPDAGLNTGGTAVTITGEFLRGASSVKFGTASATFTVDSPTQITASAPPGTGTVAVSVSTPYGTSAATPADDYAYAPAPTVGSVSPSSGPQAGGTSITITGTNLSTASDVYFGTVRASFAVFGDNQLLATAPPGTGTVNVTVVANGGRSAVSAADQYTYLSEVSGTATVSGTVKLADGAAAAGADVQLCSSVVAYGCTVAPEGPGGSYEFKDLPAGTVSMVAAEIGLVPARAVFHLAAGKSVTRDFKLAAETETNAVPLSGGVSVDSEYGAYSHGVPMIDSDSPSTITLPWHVPARIAPVSAGSSSADRVVVYVKTVTMGPTRVEVLRAAAAAFSVTYAPDGNAVGISGFYAGPAFQLAAADSRHGAAERARRSGSGGPIAIEADGCNVALEANAAGGVTLNVNGATLDWNPIAVPVTNDGIGGVASLTVNAALNAAPVTGEYNTGVQILNSLIKASSASSLTPGQRVAVFGNLYLNALTGPWSPARGIENIASNELTGAIEYGIAQPEGGSICMDQTLAFLSTAFIDPSGHVSTRAGVALEGAKVLLRRAKTRRGPFKAVPNRSAIMSPANRRNPDHTDAVGDFGWDVLPGFYRVSASRAGCKPASTRSLEVPPPALHLMIKLSCRDIRRRVSHTRIRLVTGTGREAVAIATVTAPGRIAPVGVVSFTDGTSVLAKAPLDGKSHTATAAVKLPAGKPRIVARYGGDASHRPSDAR